jgi:hypothetical protein
MDGEPPVVGKQIERSTAGHAAYEFTILPLIQEGTGLLPGPERYVELQPCLLHGDNVRGSAKRIDNLQW